MKRIRSIAALIILIILFFPCVFTFSAYAQENSSFCLTVCAEGEAIVEPMAVSYTDGQTVKQALLASGINFYGLEDGFFIYSVEGVSANYSIYYDNGGYDLDAPAAGITALLITDKADCYSPELLELTKRMMQFRLMTNNVDKYPAAQSAYNAALTGVCEGVNGDTATELLSNLNTAISDYEDLIASEKCTVNFSAVGQNNQPIEGFSLKLTDPYGNITVSESTQIEVVPGTYDFIVSLGFNRTEGTITVESTMDVSVTLPSAEWYGSIRVLDGGNYVRYEQYPSDHTAVYYIDDISSSLAINPIAARGIPDPNKTYLYKIYTGRNGEYINQRVSWASSTNSLGGLISKGMDGNTAVLEARYTGSDGFTMIQTYSLSFVRVPTLSSIKVKDTAGANLLNGFSPIKTAYSFSLTCDNYTFEASAFIDEGCSINVNGNENGSVLAIKEGDNTVCITVQHENGQSRTYILNITGTQASIVHFDVPASTTYQVFTQEGTLLSPKEDGGYALVPHEEYYYVSTKDTYFHTRQSFTASDGLMVHIAEPETVHGLEAFSFYDNSSPLYREEYKPYTDFISSTHTYSYSVPSYAQSLYAQATAVDNYTVSAEYVSQRDLNATSIIINKAVSGLSGATQLKNAITTNGYSLSITILLQKNENGVTYTQEYFMVIRRIEQLKSLSFADGKSGLLLYGSDGSSVVEFDRDVTCYTIKLQQDEEEVTLRGTVPYLSSVMDQFIGGYYVDISGEVINEISDSFTITIPLDSSKEDETISVAVNHEDPYSVPVIYTIAVQKFDPVAITFNPTPSDAIVFVMNNLTGNTVYPKDGVFYMTPGEEYTYTVTRNGYVGIEQNYVAPQQNSTVNVTIAPAEVNTTLIDLDADWPYFRADVNNNGVVDIKTPISPENAYLSWAVKLGEGYAGGATGCPILVDGYIYVYASNYICKVDTVSGEVVARGEMDRSSSFAINTPTYADGMIFVGLSDGGVQAFNADTLESLWIYNDPLKGQPNCPIAYYDGYIYTGFWIGEDKEAGYVCLSVTDEDPTNPMEEKLTTWRYVQKGGFYWAGAYVCDAFLLVGTDDGEQGYVKGFANVLSLDTKTGALIDKFCLRELGEKHFGDLRCSITYDIETDDFYFNTKGGYFYRMSVNDNGLIDHDGVRYIKLDNYDNILSCPPMSTSSPCIYNGRAYIGVSGTGQFTSYSGHNITVIDLARMKIAYTVRTQGFPQTSGLLTTAYDEGDGTIYVYFLDNMTPGKLRIISDKPGQTAPIEVVVESITDKDGIKYYDTAPVLFTPSGEQSEFVICSPIVDKYGNIYFKNDSACLMCLSNTIDRLEVTVSPDNTEYDVGECFDPTGMKITAWYSNGMSRDVTGYVSYSDEPLTADDTEFEIRFPYAMYQDRNGEAGVPYDAPTAVINLRVGDSGAVTPGDINRDGYVDETDVTLIIGHVIGSDPLNEAGMAAADMNGDTYIDENDVTMLIQLVMEH